MAFDFDASSGELSLKTAPNYTSKPYYEITIITKDEGGKDYGSPFLERTKSYGSFFKPQRPLAPIT